MRRSRCLARILNSNRSRYRNERRQDNGRHEYGEARCKASTCKGVSPGNRRPERKTVVGITRRTERRNLHDNRPLGLADRLSTGRTVLQRTICPAGMIIALAASSLVAVLPARVANRVAFRPRQVAVVACLGPGHQDESKKQEETTRVYPGQKLDCESKKLTVGSRLDRVTLAIIGPGTSVIRRSTTEMLAVVAT